MIIGNDIIDIHSINKERTHLYSFYSKILSVCEQELYKNYEDNMNFEIFVWLLWSVKEGVFKCLKRQQPDLIFSPAKIVVKRLTLPKLNDKSGLPIILIEQKGFEANKIYTADVICEGRLLHSRSLVTKDFIHTVVSEPSFDTPFYWGIKKIESTVPEAQSEQLRAFVLKRLFAVFPGRCLSIGKSCTGYPFIEADGSEMDVPLSFSHHGEYVAYAFEKEAGDAMESKF